MMRDAVYILEPEDLVLTVNRRLARLVREQQDHAQRDRGALLWPTPQVMPLSAWLEQCWEQFLDSQESSPSPVRSKLPTLLTPWQERLLWEQIITTSAQGSLLLRQAEAAELARQAWQRLQEWQVTLHATDLYDHEDAEAFYAWSEKFASICNKQGWLDQASLPRFLQSKLSQLILPKRIFLAGFTAYGQPLPPLLQQFFLALQQEGVSVADWPSLHKSAEVQAVSCATPEEELLTAARWARERVIEQPTSRIAVVVPQLERSLSQVVEIFSRIFYPGIKPSQLDARSKLFNLSLGASLSSTPMIRDALLLLSLGRGFLTIEQVTGLLHSPFWRGGEREWAERSLLDERLRRQRFLQVRVSRLRREAQHGERESPACPQLAAVLGDFLQRVQREGADTAGRTELRKPSQWMERFASWLRQLGWPGEQALSSAEYQNRLAWQELLVLFATLDKTAGLLSLNDALEQLARMANDTPFQPESEQAPVQILGILEALGGEFTHLWITGLTVDGWPPPMEANPLLPIAWQRRHGLPFSDVRREWEVAERRFQQLLQSAEQVLCSYAEQEEEQLMAPSPFWQRLPQQQREAATAVASGETDYAQLIFQSARWQWLQEEEPLPLAESALEVSSGVLKAQAHCPFQAYARYRLGARGRSEPGLGLDARQRGEVVHAALHQLWSVLPNPQQRLQSLHAATEIYIAQAVEQVLQQAAEQWPEPLHPFFRALESSRLCRLLAACVVLEQERQEPFAVVGQEVERTLRLGPLLVRLRLDRLDRLQNGSLVILDYKTGVSRVEDWLGERPQDPQLPLYVLAQNENGSEEIAAVAFCQVRAGACQFSGLAVADGLLPNVLHFQKKYQEMDSWAALLAEWQRVLSSLAERYYRGEAAVDPLPGVCQYCDLTPLCRRLEQGGAGSHEEEEA